MVLVHAWACRALGHCREMLCGTGADAALRMCSLLSKLRKLTLVTVVLSLPALQPVATRLLELNLRDSRLQGSADGFLTRGWTALTTLSLEGARVETATMTAALKLPALEEINTNGFRHQGGVLQLDQLISGCPHVRGLSFQLDKSVMQGREGSGPRRSLQSLGRLTDLSMWTMLERLHAIMDLDLPAGLTRLKFEDSTNEVDYEVDFFWALHEAAQCIRRGAHLRKLICIHTEADLQPARWGASLDEQYRRLSGQLTSLHELEVSGEAGPLLAALGAVVSSAPCLTCVKLTISVADWPPHLEFSPICSASLKSFTVGVDMLLDEGPPLPPLVLTFLPGCTRLLKVLVRFGEYAPADGTAVRIRCHACSSACIVPLNFYACRGDNVRMHYYEGPFSDVGVQLLPGPPPRQGEQSYTVMYACHAAGPQQPLTWGHVVMPGFL